MKATGSNFARGFTLMELILVLVLIAVIATFTLPSLEMFSKGQNARNASDQVVALAHYARTQAITRGISYRLNFDSAQRSYWLTMQNGASYENADSNTQTSNLGLGSASGTSTNFADVGEEPGRHFVLPDGVSLSLSVAGQPDVQYLEFRPTGRIDPAVVQIIDSSGRVMKVGCLSATEDFHLLSEDEILQDQTQRQQQPPPGASAR